MIAKPNVFQRLRLARKVFSSGLPASRGKPNVQKKSAPYVFPAWRTQTPQWQLLDYESYVTEGYMINSLAYEAITYKARAASSVSMKVYTGDKSDPTEVLEENELSMLLVRPNEFQGWKALQQLLMVYLNISGNCYLLLDRDSPEVTPRALYPLRPDRVFIIPSNDKKKIMGYLYVPEGKSWQDGTPILRQDMAHVKFPHPGDPLEGAGYGLSPMTASARSIDVDNALTGFLKQFFESGAMINLYLSFEQPMDEDVLTQAKKRFMELYGGWEQWSEVAAMDSGGEIKRFGMTFDEMRFESLDERSEARIIGPFGVPLPLLPSRLGMQASTYSNMIVARQLFWQDTLVPELGMFEDEIGFNLRSANSEYWVAYDYSNVPALQDAMKMQVDIWNDLVAWGISKHEASHMTNLPLRDLPDGDVVYMPLNYAAVDEKGIPTNPAFGAGAVSPAQAEAPAAADLATLALAAELKRANDLLEKDSKSKDRYGSGSEPEKNSL